MGDHISVVDVPGRPASFPDVFVIRVPFRFGAVALVGLLGTIWGLQYSTAKLISMDGVGAIETLFVIHCILTVIFLAVLFRTGRQFRPTVEQAAFFGVIALLGNIMPLAVELFAAYHVSAGELALIISLTPVAVLGFAFLLQSEALTGRKLIGVMFGCIAGVAILLPAAIAGGHDNLLWLSVAFIGPLAGGLGNVLMAKHWPAKLDPLQVATGNLVAGTVLLFPTAIALGFPQGLAEVAHFADWAILGFGFTVGMEFFLLALITRMGGAAFASCSDFIAICAGLGWSYLFFTEIPTMWMIAAACLCVVALKFAADGAFSVSRVESELA